MRTKKLAVAAAAAVAFALAVAGCSSSSGASGGSGDSAASGSKSLQEVSVGQVPLSLFSPLYVADAKGYFKQEGIKLNLQAVKSGQDAIPLASSGKLDVVVAGFSAGMFNAINTGLDVKVVGSMAVAAGDPDSSATHLVVAKKDVDSGTVKSIADLKGKKIGAAGGPGGTGGYLVAMALKKGGLTLSDVQVVNLGNPDMPTALQNGSLDAGLMSAPFSLTSIKDGTGVSMAVPPKGYSGTGVIYGGKFAKSPLAQKFFDALAKGSKDVQGSKAKDAANLKIIAAATGQTIDQLKATPFDTWLPNLAPLPDQLQSMQKVWIQAKATSYTSPIPSSKFIDSSFSKKAK